MQTQFKPGDIVDVEIYAGQPIFPGEPEIPMIVRGRIVDLCEVAFGVIPVYREGARIVASRRVLREHHLRASKGEHEAA